MFTRIALLVSLMLGSAPAQTHASPARVSSLLRRAVVLDLHDDTTQMILDEGFDFAVRHDYGQVDLPRMREGHATGVFFSIWTDPLRYTPAESMRRALDQIDAIRRIAAGHPREMRWLPRPGTCCRPASAARSRPSWVWKAAK